MAEWVVMTSAVRGTRGSVVVYVPVLAALAAACFAMLGCDASPGRRHYYGYGSPDEPRVLAAFEKIRQQGGSCPEHLFAPMSPGLMEITLGAAWKGGSDALVLLEPLRGIHKLVLDSDQIDDRGPVHLPKLDWIVALECKRTVIGDEGLRHLRGVRGLRLLVLDGSRVTDAGLEALAGHDLMWLILHRASQITDAGLSHLRGMKKLLVLKLEGAQIAGPGLAQLADLHELRDLDLSGTPIGDDALAHLMGFKKLSTLTVSRTQVTESGLERLKTLPRLRTIIQDDRSIFLDAYEPEKPR